MLGITKSRLVATVAILTMGNAAHSSDLMSLYDSACNSMGIDPERCHCVAQEVIERHGEDAARYIALDMNLRYDEAAAALERAGEDNAYAASETFEEAQYKECSSGRLARQEGEYAATVPEAVSVSSDAVAGTQQPVLSSTTLNAVFDSGQAVPLIDLSSHPAGGIVDVSAQFGNEALASSSSRNMKNFIGFYAVVDRNGGIDTSGDGVANVHPGDENYSATAQGRALSNKLYWNANGDNQQYLGEVRLPGGERFVPLVMYRGNGQTTMPTLDPTAMREQLLRGMKTNANLFFPYDSANPDKELHIRTIDQQSFGFRDDIVVIVDGLTLN